MPIVDDHQDSAFTDGTTYPIPTASPRDFQGSLPRDRGVPIGAPASSWNIGWGANPFANDTTNPNNNCSAYFNISDGLPAYIASDGTATIKPTAGAMALVSITNSWNYFQTSSQTTSGINCIINRADLIPAGTYSCNIYIHGLFADTDTAAIFNIVSQDGTQTIDVTPAGFAFSPTSGPPFNYPFTIDSASLFGRSTQFFVQIILSGVPYGGPGGFAWSSPPNPFYH